MLTVHSLTSDRLAFCAANLCRADLAELRAAEVADVLSMLGSALPDCRWASEARWNGEPIAIYGVRPVDKESPHVGVPWMLATTALAKAERAAVARQARREVRRMRAEFEVLCNLVHAENANAIRFVEWLGFDVGTKPAGPGGRFRSFVWRKAACATP
jgi:nucleotide-binding universal stress UspA family protein